MTLPEPVTDPDLPENPSDDPRWTTCTRANPPEKPPFFVKNPPGHPKGSYVTAGGLLVSGPIHYQYDVEVSRFPPGAPERKTWVVTGCGAAGRPFVMYDEGLRATPWFEDVTCDDCAEVIRAARNKGLRR